MVCVILRIMFFTKKTFKLKIKVFFYTSAGVWNFDKKQKQGTV